MHVCILFLDYICISYDLLLMQTTVILNTISLLLDQVVNYVSACQNCQWPIMHVVVQLNSNITDVSAQSITVLLIDYYVVVTTCMHVLQLDSVIFCTLVPNASTLVVSCADNCAVSCLLQFLNCVLCTYYGCKPP